MLNDNQMRRGEDIVFNLFGDKVYSFADIEQFKSGGSVKFKLFFYPNGINKNDINWKKRLRVVNSSFLKLTDSPTDVGGWTLEDETNNGYIQIFPKNGKYGKCECTIPWQETQDIEAGGYTMELLWSTAKDQYRSVMAKNSIITIVGSISEDVNKDYNIN